MHIRAIRPDDRAEWVRMQDILWPGSQADHEQETQRFFTEPALSLATFVLEWSDGRLGGFIELAERPYAKGCTSSPVGQSHAARSIDPPLLPCSQVPEVSVPLYL
jgi:aminoglycoside 6'-N-acetyltransferase I